MGMASFVQNLLARSNTWLAENVFSNLVTFSGTANFTGTKQVGGATAKMIIFNEGELACSADSNRAVAHGLGGKADCVQLYLECVTADDGFAVGEQLYMGSSVTFGTANGGMQACIRNNATQFEITQALYLYGISISTLNVVTLDQTKWKIRWKAWRFV